MVVVGRRGLPGGGAGRRRAPEEPGPAEHLVGTACGGCEQGERGHLREGSSR